MENEVNQEYIDNLEIKELNSISMKLYLISGTISLLAGIIIFIVANFHEISAVKKIAFLATSILGCGAYAAYKGLSKKSSKWVLFIAAILAGPLIYTYYENFTEIFMWHEFFITWLICSCAIFIIAPSDALAILCYAIFIAIINPLESYTEYYYLYIKRSIYHYNITIFILGAALPLVCYEITRAIYKKINKNFPLSNIFPRIVASFLAVIYFIFIFNTHNNFKYFNNFNHLIYWLMIDFKSLIIYQDLIIYASCLGFILWFYFIRLDTFILSIATIPFFTTTLAVILNINRFSGLWMIFITLIIFLYAWVVIFYTKKNKAIKPEVLNFLNETSTNIFKILSLSFMAILCALIFYYATIYLSLKLRLSFIGLIDLMFMFLIIFLPVVLFVSAITKFNQRKKYIITVLFLALIGYLASFKGYYDYYFQLVMPLITYLPVAVLLNYLYRGNRITAYITIFIILSIMTAIIFLMAALERDSNSLTVALDMLFLISLIKCRSYYTYNQENKFKSIPYIAYNTIFIFIVINYLISTISYTEKLFSTEIVTNAFNMLSYADNISAIKSSNLGIIILLLMIVYSYINNLRNLLPALSLLIVIFIANYYGTNLPLPIIFLLLLEPIGKDDSISKAISKVRTISLYIVLGISISINFYTFATPLIIKSYFLTIPGVILLALFFIFNSYEKKYSLKDTLSTN